MKGNKFKKVILMGLMIATTAVNTFGGTIPKVKLNGDKLLIQQSPFVQNGRTYIPLRAVSENLGAKVTWEGKTQTITIEQGYKTIVCRINNDTARVNNQVIQLDAPPQLKLGTTYVPLRFTADCLGAKVDYDKNSNSINITYEVPKQENKKYVGDREVRTTNLPKNYKDFEYILASIPNEMYELKADYEYKNNAVEGKNYIKPFNIKKDSFYSEENLQKWKQTIEKNLDLKLNVDYKTIDNTWAEQMTKTYIASQKEGQGNYNKYLKYTKDYIQSVKQNKIVVEGDYYVEPSICYNSSGAMYMRAWVKFTVKEGSNIELYEKNSSTLKRGVTYTGYVDIGLATNNGNSRGQDLGIYDDSISQTPGIKETKESLLSTKTSSLNISLPVVSASAKEEAKWRD